MNVKIYADSPELIEKQVWKKLGYGNWVLHPPKERWQWLGKYRLFQRLSEHKYLGHFFRYTYVAKATRRKK